MKTNNSDLFNYSYTFLDLETEDKLEFFENPYEADYKKKKTQNPDPAYDISILNTSIPANEIVEMISNANKYDKKYNNESTGIRILFYGVSGTGKTNLAHYLADSIEKEILHKNASEIFGRHVGETEQNISKAFDEAKKEDKVLLFDEADSFFINREVSEHIWERTSVNEFLTQFDRFKGIVICTTNFRGIMDPAMQRRFHIMVEFKPLKQEGVRTLLEKYFPDCIFTYTEIEKLCSYESATPGDFGNLKSRLRFLNEDKITSQYIIQELCKMQEEKNLGFGKIGF